MYINLLLLCFSVQIKQKSAKPCECTHQEISFEWTHLAWQVNYIFTSSGIHKSRPWPLMNSEQIHGFTESAPKYFECFAIKKALTAFPSNTDSVYQLEGNITAVFLTNRLPLRWKTSTGPIRVLIMSLRRILFITLWIVKDAKSLYGKFWFLAFCF